MRSVHLHRAEPQGAMFLALCIITPWYPTSDTFFPDFYLNQNDGRTRLRLSSDNQREVSHDAMHGFKD